ncbi:SAM-dependent methyltransferase [Rhodospirillaceae bacterium LM-1]|nr:SAM-dependent methyltransferase [Rhodospirillaceae bacterium LM-1]
MTSPSPGTLFDRGQLKRQRLRAMAGFAAHEFLFQEAAQRLADRLLDVRRDFPLAFELGAKGGLMGNILRGQARIGQLVSLDCDAALLAPHSPGIVADPELPPLAPACADLVVGCLALHWVNDLPGLLAQIRQVLKPGGLFLASMLGGGTLRELREAFLLAESDISGGASPRVIPMADIKDLGGLLQRARFDLPVADSETLTVQYANPLSLLADLRGMGEGNAMVQRSRRPLTRQVLLRMAQLYQERHSGPDGRVPASFEIITLTGWVGDSLPQRG